MRKEMIALAVLAGVAAIPAIANAQAVIVRDGETVGVVADDSFGITDDLRPRFREYVVQENVPNYSVPGQVMVGARLPEIGVTYYDVPSQYGAHRYRYSRVNGEYVIVEPQTRKIIQVIE
ncbi:MAG: DUF1236 domain-containing protein [Xanthobacteraceae bacterium]|nr:DUF1236 domain-containing protein [Xanthobacteraceae bacterium]